MKNVVLVDFEVPKNWEFIKALEKASGKKWFVEALASNIHHGGKVQNIIRYIKYFWLPLNIFMRRKEYESVLAWQQFYGLILAFYFRLFHIKRNVPDITVMTFIYKEKHSLVGKIYNKFIHYIVTSGYIKRFVVFSHNEQTHYANLFNVPKEWFLPEVLGIEDLKDSYEVNISDDLYFLSAGRSNRDYKFLFDNWKNKKQTLKVICDTYKDNTVENIIILNKCYDEMYLKELAGCRAVIIPLHDENISSGQLVILQAMMFGKPVIITKNNTVYDYIEHDLTGIIIEKTEKALNDALVRLEDLAYYQKISHNARKCFEEKYTLYGMGYRIGCKLR